MENILIEGYEFIKIDLDGATAVFSTAKNNLDFNKATVAGRRNIENLKKWFKLKNVGYLSQVHGDKLIIYKNKIEDADGIFTGESNTAVGVFNADCVPILLYDKEKGIIAAVHSGWRGTYNLILSKAIEKLEREYKSNVENIKVYIGPHIGVCCYTVGEELIAKFKNSMFYKDKDIFVNNNLDLKKCLLYQLKDKGIKDRNINCLDICTSCSSEYKLHSYRKNKKCGRQFSFLYLN
ncbi:peptidoglycan editing factor PgeF [Clostridium tyrobutyricum]|uniref:peptidoglycan editing factor PgeF n=1 Tax=Clostridium tyrobutyricum TaxID=1519 RepID=UPI00057D52B5|nr:peptidoglycan editing factor PgeF [Clostridium tyrobutyricum]MBV4445156.1 peptidoglycan editing factor PgeF [Clostridium tyrobutyricum]